MPQMKISTTSVLVTGAHDSTGEPMTIPIPLENIQWDRSNGLGVATKGPVVIDGQELKDVVSVRFVGRDPMRLLITPSGGEPFVWNVKEEITVTMRGGLFDAARKFRVRVPEPTRKKREGTQFNCLDLTLSA